MSEIDLQLFIYKNIIITLKIFINNFIKFKIKLSDCQKYIYINILISFFIQTKYRQNLLTKDNLTKI